jgi:F-type H+-transporting ATPase subunit delta
LTDRVIADRYAQALVGLVSDLKELDRINSEIELISNLLEIDNSFRKFFLSPRILPGIKKELFQNVFKDRVSDDVLNLFLLIIDKHREGIFSELAKRFKTLADQIRGVETGTVITAVPIQDDEFQALENAVQKFSRRRITLIKEVDPGIIGGVVLWLGDHVIDGSIRYRLETIKRNLLEIKTHMPESSKDLS